MKDLQTFLFSHNAAERTGLPKTGTIFILTALRAGVVGSRLYKTQMPVKNCDLVAASVHARPVSRLSQGTMSETKVFGPPRADEFRPGLLETRC